MNTSIEITGDITPENLRAKILEHARQCVEEELRSMTPAQAEAAFGKPSACHDFAAEAEVYGLRYALLGRSRNAARLRFPAGIGSSPEGPLSPTGLRARVFLTPRSK